MKSFTKLSFAALTIAIGFTACTKDNSTKPSSTTSTAKFTMSAQSLSKKDTIQPSVKSSLLAPSAKKDTIQPK